MSDTRFGQLTAAYIFLALLLGGASAGGVIANMLLQLAALPLAVMAVHRLTEVPVDARTRRALLLLAGIVALPLFQLIPLPSSIWTGMPGREGVESGLVQLDAGLGFQAISLAPSRTMAAFLGMIVPVAVFLAILTVRGEDRKLIGWTVLAAAALSMLVGLIQLSVGRSAYFYQFTNLGSPVGFFANRNHLATLLLCAIPVLTMQMPSAASETMTTANRLGRRVVLLMVLIMLLIGVVLTGSRAGIALALPTLALSYALTLRSHSGMSPWPVLLASALVGFIVITLLLFGPYFARMQVKTLAIGEDVRVIAAPIAAGTGWKYFPFGTGIGSFDPVFRWQANAVSLGPTYINHAHNDYVELWMTGGLGAVLLGLAFAIWFYRSARTNWAARSVNPGAMARIATVGIIVMGLHSIVDYPLRTAGLSALFAGFCAMLLPPVLPIALSGSAPGNSSRRLRHEPQPTSFRPPPLLAKARRPSRQEET